MGYHRPVSSFNIGKQGEHAERRHFRETVALAAPAPALVPSQVSAPAAA
jgi:ribonucleoside-triphosphate reductase